MGTHPLLLVTAFVYVAAQLPGQAAADYKVEVRLVSYSNPDNRQADGRYCDGALQNRPCDNVFTIEQQVGGGWETQVHTGIYRDNDNITFGDILEVDFPNPLEFTGGQQCQNKETLRITVDDDDGANRPHQNVLQNIVTLELSQEPKTLEIINTTRRGNTVYKSRTLQLSYWMVCIGNYYGPDCSVYCVPQDGSYACNTAKGCSAVPTESDEGRRYHVNTGAVIVGGILICMFLTLLLVAAVWIVKRQLQRNKAERRECRCTCETKNRPNTPYKRNAKDEAAVLGEEPTSMSDTRAFRAAYSLCSPDMASPHTEDSDEEGQHNHPDRGREGKQNQYAYIRLSHLSPRAQGYEVPVRGSETHGRFVSTGGGTQL